MRKSSEEKLWHSFAPGLILCAHENLSDARPQTGTRFIFRLPIREQLWGIAFAATQSFTAALVCSEPSLNARRPCGGLRPRCVERMARKSLNQLQKGKLAANRKSGERSDRIWNSRYRFWLGLKNQLFAYE